MGILNVTPDSFSDGGKFNSLDAAVAQAEALAAAGADIIDVGGESTRPGAHPVDPQEQIRRVQPAIAAIARQIPDITISIDTTHSSVAGAACDSGARLVNDISAGRDDPQMFSFVAQHNLPIVLMHMRGTPLTMDQMCSYENVVSEVGDFLADRRAAALAAGIASENILFDPGIGFAKNDSQNLQLIREVASLVAMGQPVVIGASRKRFIGRITNDPEPSMRVMGTAAISAWCATNGVGIMRVHDVEATQKIIRMTNAIMGKFQ
jgi:dihydropteroate synthase